MDESITPILLPKWGIDMSEGRIVRWLAAEGETVEAGGEIVEVESEKTTAAIEAGQRSLLRRRIAQEGDVVPVGGLLGVLAPASVADAAIDEFVNRFHATPRAVARRDPDHETIDVLGHSLRYLSIGDAGPPVLLVHGFGGDLRGWGPVQLALSRRFRTVSMDLPAHGGSSRTITTAGTEHFVEVIAQVVRALGLDPAHLVGHSWGAELALAAADRHPESVASLTLIGSAGPLTPAAMNYLTAFIEANRRADVRKVLQQLFFDPNRVTRDMVEETLRYKRVEVTDDALRKIAAGACATRDARDRALAAAVPTQIIAGREDRICPLGEEFSPHDGVGLHLLDGVGHMPHMEASARVAALIEDFVTRSAPRP